MRQIELQAGHQLGQIPGFIAIGSLGAVMLGISLYSRAKLVKNTHDFVIAGRKLGFGFGVAGLVSVWTWVVGILMPAAVTYSWRRPDPAHFGNSLAEDERYGFCLRYRKRACCRNHRQTSLQ